MYGLINWGKQGFFVTIVLFYPPLGTSCLYSGLLCGSSQYGRHWWTVHVWVLASRAFPRGPGSQYCCSTMGTQWTDHCRENRWQCISRKLVLCLISIGVNCYQYQCLLFLFLSCSWTVLFDSEDSQPLSWSYEVFCCCCGWLVIQSLSVLDIQ